MRYVLAIDQSTQGTKALLFDENGTLVGRADVPHEQIVNDRGWVSHDMQVIYENTIKAVGAVIAKTGVDSDSIAALGITNQRETSLIWDEAGRPLADAVVWQCTRALDICERFEKSQIEKVREITGIPLSPYYPAAKLSWLIENTTDAKQLMKERKLRMGTVDTWLVYKFTDGQVYKTDYSNASRTQLFDISKLEWSGEICEMFGIDAAMLAQVCDSNSCFGHTDIGGTLKKPIPIYSVIGDSHAALFGQGCFKIGMVKTTYGTGSSIMMNIGENPKMGKSGVVTSLAWGLNGRVTYVLEGNIIYTGGVISWLKNGLEIIADAQETAELTARANQTDGTYIVPAFTGLGAPYWDSDARAVVYGMGSGTKKAEFVKAGVESIAYQINDVLQAMEADSGVVIEALRVDGGATKNEYLMRFQSDISAKTVSVAQIEELSGIGAGYMAGIAAEIMDEDAVFERMRYEEYHSKMPNDVREGKLEGWRKAVCASRL